MDQDPQVAVIIVCYNHAKFIKDSIVSVYQQTYSNIKLLVVNNHSQDTSDIIIRKLQMVYDFEYINQENIGAPQTINKVVPPINCKYFSCFSGDDILLPKKIEQQVNFLEINKEYGMCYGKSIFINSEGIEITRQKNRHYRSGLILPDLIRYKYHPSAPTYMFRKSAMDNVGWYDRHLMYLEDSYMNIKISTKYPIGFLDEFLVYQRKHQNNLTYSIDYDILLKESDYIIECFKEYKFYKTLKKYAALDNFSFFAEFNRKYALRFVKSSMRLFYKKKFIKSFISFLKLYLK